MANRTRKNEIYLMLSDDELEILNKKYKLPVVKTFVNLLWSIYWKKIFSYLIRKFLRICLQIRENNLSVIYENYKRFKSRYSTNGKSYMEYTKFKRGNSWKNKLQIAINKAVLKSKTYEEFLKIMEDLPELKHLI